MPADTLFTPETLEKQFSRWELAIFASDLHMFTDELEEQTANFKTLLVENSEADAWLRMTGSPMPPTVSSHWAVRKRMRRELSKPKHAAHTLSRWLSNYRQLKEQPYTCMQRLCQRFQAFALTVPPDEVAALTPQATTWDTVSHLVHVLRQDWATAASVTVLLHLMRVVQTTKPEFVGSITAIPSTWSSIPALTQVYTDRPLPVSVANNRYAVLFQTADTTSVAIVSARVGHEAEWKVPLRRHEQPQWIVERGNQVAVGSTHCVTVVDGDEAEEWPTDAQPPGRVMSKFDSTVVWAEKSELHGLNLSTMTPIRDSSLLQQRVLAHARTAVCACVDKSIVFSHGEALFQLPRVGQRILAVHRSGVHLVDVFTTVGDWWRVDTETLEAFVVGLDVPPKAKVVDVCVY